jgi:hypothetical protein
MDIGKLPNALIFIELFKLEAAAILLGMDRGTDRTATGPVPAQHIKVFLARET